MTRPIVQLRRYSILIHRWMGVAFCVLFAVWFASGIVLMYWDFPLVRDDQRVARSPALNPAALRLSPKDAFERLGADNPPDRVRLTTVADRPVYRFEFEATSVLIYADDGTLLDGVSRATAARIAAAWSRHNFKAGVVEGITEPDQWTVYPEIRAAGPFWKSTYPDSEEVYVSQATGDVVQDTTRGSRIGAYFGAIPHWLYFTPLRKATPLWREVIIGLSAAGILMNLFGLAVGIWLYSPLARRYRFPSGDSSIPYSGQKRLHTIFGLLFGIFALTWVISGMLSMNPLRWSPDEAKISADDALRGGTWRAEDFLDLSPAAALAEVSAQMQVRELELAVVLGEPVYIAREALDRLRIMPVRGLPRSEFDAAPIRYAIGQAIRPYRVAEARRITAYDNYYIDRHYRKPLPALFVRLNDRDESTYYVDLKTARVVQSYDSRSRWNRWLYHGLHSIDLPWLYRNRPAWDIAVLFLMMGGTTLCVTSVVIGWRRILYKFRSLRNHKFI